MEKLKKLFFLLALVFIFSSCQKCYECRKSDPDDIDYEVEFCEDDDDLYGDVDYMKEQYENEGYKCYVNLW